MVYIYIHEYTYIVINDSDTYENAAVTVLALVLK